jgi:hypothetical protein
MTFSRLLMRPLTARGRAEASDFARQRRESHFEGEASFESFPVEKLEEKTMRERPIDREPASGNRTHSEKKPYISTSCGFLFFFRSFCLQA